MSVEPGHEPPERAAALEFVRTEAGFAQIVTLGRSGFPVGRTASAFLRDDWSVDLVQRRTHRRLGQLRRDARVLTTWVGSPDPGSTNNTPAVFDLGLGIPRAVFVQGDAEFLDAEATWDAYSEHHQALRRRGLTKAPDRDRAAVDTDLTGLRIRPRRIRLEGFGAGAETFTWNIATEGTAP
jgi:hypothetical protein